MYMQAIARSQEASDLSTGGELLFLVVSSFEIFQTEPPLRMRSLAIIPPKIAPPVAQTNG